MATENQKITLQQQFDAEYISSQEIADYVGVSTVAVFKAMDTGRITAPPITVGGGRGIHLWLRKDISQLLIDWKNKRDYS